MNYISINTQKRNGKLAFSIFVGIIVIIIAISVLSSLISQFSWWMLGLLAVLGLAIFGLYDELKKGLKYKDVKVVAEIIGNDKVKFYNTASNGEKWNESEHKLSNMSRVYILKKKSRTSTDKYIQYKCVNYKIDPTTNIEILPDLFDATDEDITKILAFLKYHRNEIELGYVSFWSK